VRKRERVLRVSIPKELRPHITLMAKAAILGETEQEVAIYLIRAHIMDMVGGGYFTKYAETVEALRQHAARRLKAKP
jgi:hypothetical protein